MILTQKRAERFKLCLRSRYRACVDFDDARALIDLQAIRANVRLLSALAGVPLLAPIKANAYGHGLVPVARFLETESLVQGFGVATAEEALTLRCAGVEKLILLFVPPSPASVRELIAAEIRFVVSSLDELNLLAREAKVQGKPVYVHLKLNTGLNRLGANEDEAKQILVQVNHLGLVLEGVMTHLIDSEDEVPQHAVLQLERFTAFLNQHRLELPFIHVSNTGAVLHPLLRHQAQALGATLARPGIGLYGYPAGPDVAVQAQLNPAMTLESRICFLRRVRAGEVASYNATWRASRETTIASVRFGYADGYPRTLSNRGRVLVKGTVCSVIGRVCMDQLLVDVTDLDLRVGERVTLFGPGPITAQTLAELAETNVYELLVRLGQRIEREYFA